MKLFTLSAIAICLVAVVSATYYTPPMKYGGYQQYQTAQYMPIAVAPVGGYGYGGGFGGSGGGFGGGLFDLIFFSKYLYTNQVTYL